jgi:hypothetical protein
MSLFNHEFGSQGTYNVFVLRNKVVHHLVTPHFLIWFVELSESIHHHFILYRLIIIIIQ